MLGQVMSVCGSKAGFAGAAGFGFEVAAATGFAGAGVARCDGAE